MSLPICKFHSNNKSCRFGKNCRNLHPPRPPLSKDLHDSENGKSVEDPEKTVATATVPITTSPRVNETVKNGKSVDSIVNKLDSLTIQVESAKEHGYGHGNTEQKSDKKQICKYFSRGVCLYGDKCRFLHIKEASKSRKPNLPPRLREGTSNNGNEDDQSNKVNIIDSQKNVAKSSGNEQSVSHNQAQAGDPREHREHGHLHKAKKNCGNTKCPFFKQNRCNRGDRCRYANSTKNTDSESRQSAVKTSPLKRVQSNKDDMRKNEAFLTYEEAEKIGYDKLRDCEISVIQKRFSRNQIKFVKADEEGFEANVIFTPSDPKWPYELNSFELLVSVSREYPKTERLKVSLPKEQDIPETIRRYIDMAISNWLKEYAEQKKLKNQCELMFRPFYEWLDVSICDITTEAFKQLKRELDYKENTDNSRVQRYQPATRPKGPEQPSNTNRAGRTVPARPVVIRPYLTLEEAEKFGLDKLRESEITVVQKRFTKEKLKVVENGDDFVAVVTFSPSDPDWPFDINSFELLVTIAKDYPKEMLRVSLPKDQNMPETVRRYIDITISEWLVQKKKQKEALCQVELMFRPFLKWFDRSIDDITTEALKQFKRELVAKAAGIEILSPAQLQEKLQASSSGESSDDSDTDSQSGDSEDDESEEEEDSSDEEDDSPGVTLDLDPDRKGTEVELRHLQLKENAATLMFDKIKLVLQCGRCKNHADLIVHQNRVVSLRCGKCNQQQLVNFRAAIIHSFSSTVGYLDLEGCTAFDLILQDCRAQVACGACAKFTKIEGLSTGQMVSGWCQACNARFKVATESVKFTQLVSSEVPKGTTKVLEAAPTKARKPPKDPAIREGMPLPDFGTCRHYKHSYRWLRFPCCGKAYPCDICHDKKEDHEFTFANRMICGHCCKEQNYSPDRPCVACGHHMTKVRSAHWEGGQGCRDKVAMSRGDAAKHRNQSKTTSNHKKKVLNGGRPAKKNTKLRHS